MASELRLVLWFPEDVPHPTREDIETLLECEVIEYVSDEEV